MIERVRGCAARMSHAPMRFPPCATRHPTPCVRVHIGTHLPRECTLYLSTATAIALCQWRTGWPGQSPRGPPMHACMDPARGGGGHSLAARFSPLCNTHARNVWPLCACHAMMPWWRRQVRAAHVRARVQRHPQEGRHGGQHEQRQAREWLSGSAQTRLLL